MGQSVLTPEVNLLGKACRASLASSGVGEGLSGIGGKGIRPKFRNLQAGNWSCKAANNGGSKGKLVRGEFSFLFDVADASNDISVGERRLNT